MKCILDINAVLLILAMLIIAAFVLSQMSIKYISEKQVEEELNLKEDKYAMHYALEAAKLYAEISLKYSLYQACYDVSRNSGVNEKTFNGEKYSVLPPESEFTSALKKTTENYLKVYLADGYNFLSEYQVVFPNYEIELKNENEKIFATASAKDNIKIASEKEVKNSFSEETVLEKNSSIQISTDIDCRNIQSFAYAEKSEIEKNMENAINTIFNSNFATEYTQEYEGAVPDCSEVFKQKTGFDMGNAKNKIFEQLKTEIRGLGKKGSNELEMQIGLLDINLKVEENGRSITEGEKNTVTCKFAYTLTVFAKVVISGKEELPVIKGRDIGFQAIQLSFYIENNKIAK